MVTSFIAAIRSASMAGAIAASALLVAVAPASASPTFATYSNSTTGSLNGVGFTMSGLSNAGFGGDIQSLAMNGADWNNVGSQQGRIYDGNGVTTFTVTFAAPVSGLQMYLYYFRGGTGGGGGYASYDFGQAFTITGGLGSPITQSGTTLNTSAVNFAAGVITFTGPVSSLTVTTTGGPATGGDQGFTFAAPAAVPGVAGVAVAAITGLATRRRRR